MNNRLKNAMSLLSYEEPWTWVQAEQLAQALEKINYTIFMDKARTTNSVYLDVVTYTDETEDFVDDEWSIRISDHEPGMNHRGRRRSYDFEIGPYQDADATSWEPIFKFFSDKGPKTAHLSHAIKALKINKEDLQCLWYENEQGDKFVPRFDEGPPEVPDEYKYQISRFPNELTTTYLKILPDGSSTEVMSGHATWPTDLVFAMVKSDDFTMDEAIIVASESCGRCLNVLCYEYGLDDGYPEGSEEWQKANTECDFCKGL